MQKSIDKLESESSRIQVTIANMKSQLSDEAAKLQQQQDETLRSLSTEIDKFSSKLILVGTKLNRTRDEMGETEMALRGEIDGVMLKLIAANNSVTVLQESDQE